MSKTVYNSSKQRLETLPVGLNTKNTTWFDDVTNAQDVHTITDMDGGLLVARLGYDYAIWFDGISRNDVNYSRQEAKDLVDSLTSSNREK